MLKLVHIYSFIAWKMKIMNILFYLLTLKKTKVIIYTVRNQTILA